MRRGTKRLSDLPTTARLGNVHLKWLQPSSLYSQMWCFIAGLCAPSPRWVCLQNDLMMPRIWKTFRDLILWAIPCTKVLCPEINQGFFLEKKKVKPNQPGLEQVECLSQASFWSVFHHVSISVVKFSHPEATQMPWLWRVNWVFSGEWHFFHWNGRFLGWGDGGMSVCVCVCAHARALVCPVKQAFRWRNAASDLFGCLWRSWQTWTFSLAGRKKDCLFPKYQRKAWCRWGLHQRNVAGSRSCRCCPWPRTCTSWVRLEKEGCQSPHRTALLSQGWMKKMFQCCGWIWVVCHGGQKVSYKIPFT